MSGSDTQDASQQANDTLSSLLGGVQDAYDAGNTYVQPSATTNQGWTDALTAAANTNYTTANDYGLSDISSFLGNGGLSYQQDLAQNNAGTAYSDYGALGDNQGLNSNLQSSYDAYTKLANDVASGADTQAIKDDITNDTLQSVNKAFNSSGMFGSDSNQESAASGVASALAQYDYDNYWKSVDAQNAALSGATGVATTGSGNQYNSIAGQQSASDQLSAIGQQAVDNTQNLTNSLASYYANSQAPASTEQAVGTAIDDANNEASNSEVDWLSNLFGAMQGTTSTDSSSSADWWQQALGYLMSAA